MRPFEIVAVFFSLVAAAPAAMAGEIRVVISQGRVSIVAKDATVSQILREWSRVGQVRDMNVDRVPGGPITLELSNLPEQEALDILLRNVGGFVLSRRPVAVDGLSVFDRIFVLPTVARLAPVQAAAQVPAQESAFVERPGMAPGQFDARAALPNRPVESAPHDTRQPAPGSVAGGWSNGVTAPLPASAPPPAAATSSQPAAGAFGAALSAPVTTARPGMMTQPPPPSPPSTPPPPGPPVNWRPGMATRPPIVVPGTAPTARPGQIVAPRVEGTPQQPNGSGGQQPQSNP